MVERGGSTDPSKHADTIFALYSIPAFDAGAPDFVAGATIGSSKKNVEANDVLLSRIVPHIRRSWIVGAHDEATIASSEWIVFRDRRIHPNYLRHFLISDLFHKQFMMTVAGVGGSLLRARPADVARIVVNLPPLDEQRRIAAILDNADALRQKRKRAIALLDGLLDSVLEKAFSEVSANLTMADLFDVQGGLQLSRSRASLPLKVPYLRVANVYRDALDLSEIKMMGMTEAELARTRLVEGDILFVEGHGNADQVGRSAVWDGSVAGCSHQNHLIRARAKLGSVEPKVISRWLNSRLGRKHLLKRGKTTSGLNTISVSDVRAAPIPSLSPEEYGHMRRQIDLLETRRSSMLSDMMKLSSLFASLQHRAFSGQI